MAVNKDDAVNMVTTSTVEQPKSGGPGRTSRYLREVMVELKKTEWPTKDELTKSVVVIVFTIFVAAVFLALCDWVIAHFMEFVGIVKATSGK